MHLVALHGEDDGEEDGDGEGEVGGGLGQGMHPGHGQLRPAKNLYICNLFIYEEVEDK